MRFTMMRRAQRQRPALNGRGASMLHALPAAAVGIEIGRGYFLHS